MDDVAAAIGSVPGVPAARVRDFLKQQHSDDSGLVDYTGVQTNQDTEGLRIEGGTRGAGCYRARRAAARD